MNGTIRFSEATIESRDLQGQWSGEPLSIEISTNERGANIHAKGRASIAELRHFYDLPVFEQLSGRTDWQAAVLMRDGKLDLNLSSDLRGITSALPDPFNKGAATSMPLSLTRQNMSSGGRKSPGAVEQVWRMSLGNAAAGLLVMNSRGQLLRGRIVVGTGQSQPNPDMLGLQLESLKPVDLDFWLRAMGLSQAKQRGGATARTQVPPLAISLKAPMLKAFGRKFQDFRASVQTTADRTGIQMSSRELQGELEWIPPGVGDAGDRGLLRAG